MIHMPRQPFFGDGRSSTPSNNPFFTRPMMQRNEQSRIGRRRMFEGRHDNRKMHNESRSHPINIRGGSQRRLPQQHEQTGLLAKLFRNNEANNPSPFSRQVVNRSDHANVGGSSIFQTLTTPGAMDGFFNNTQQVLKTAQSIGPIVEQYSPMVRNIPMLWNVYRNLKEPGDQDNTSLEKDEESSEGEFLKKGKKRSTSQTNELSVDDVPEKRTTDGKSIPKMYV